MKKFNENIEPNKLFSALAPRVYQGRKLLSNIVKFQELKNVKFEEY